MLLHFVSFVSIVCKNWAQSSTNNPSSLRARLPQNCARNVVEEIFSHFLRFYSDFNIVSQWINKNQTNHHQIVQGCARMKYFAVVLLPKRVKSDLVCKFVQPLVLYLIHISLPNLLHSFKLIWHILPKLLIESTQIIAKSPLLQHNYH